MILIGSIAAAFRGYKTERPIIDVDVVATWAEYRAWLSVNRPKSYYPAEQGKKMICSTKDLIVEFEIAWEGSSAQQLANLVAADAETFVAFESRLGVNVMVPSLDVLFALKSSHRYLRNSPHFKKTRTDFLAMRDNRECRIPEAYQEWYKAREKETYNYKHPNLNQDKKGFFSGDQIQYVYDHDSIHEAVKLFDVPAYKKFQREGAQVAVDKKKWDELPHTWKLASVIEEAKVLALERSQIPHAGEVTPDWSFETALTKVCTSITSGWWREFAYDNFDTALHCYDRDYVTRFWDAVRGGVVKRVTSSGPAASSTMLPSSSERLSNPLVVLAGQSVKG